MRKRFVDRLHELRATQHGFTLLELLIGVVIVSILAAIATQYFLQHRRKGWEAQVRASTRHMAGAQNYFVFEEGASAFTNDLDDLYMAGYRWDDLSVRPYVALATKETYCVQVHSAYDPAIVWHFSSNTGYPQEGPATPSDCGDPEVLGTYIAGLPPASAGRDGVPGDGTVASADGPGGTASGGGAPTGDGTGTGTGGTGGTGTGTGGTTDLGTGTSGGSIDITDPGTGGTGGTSGTGGVGDPGGSGSTGGNGGSGSGGNGGSGSGGNGGSGSGGNGGSGSGGNGGSGSGGNGGSGSGGNGGSGSGGNGGSGGGDGVCKKDDKSDPDGDGNGGQDAPGGSGGTPGGQDCNNGSGNDADGEDDNNGGGKGGK